MKDMLRDGNLLSDWWEKKATLMHSNIGFYANVLGWAFSAHFGGCTSS